MSRICALPFMLRQHSFKNLRITSSSRYLSYSPRLLSQNLTSTPQCEFHNNRPTSGRISLLSGRKFDSPAINAIYSWRNYSSEKPTNKNNPASSDGSKPASSDDGKPAVRFIDEYSDSSDDWSSDDDDMRFSDRGFKISNSMEKSVPSTNTVPDYFPQVPMIATPYPLFPKFMKVFEITDPKLIKLIELKLSVNAPYAGVFMRKSQDPTINNAAEVKDLNECHPVGTFVKFTEINRTGDKLELVATSHRRIQIEKQLKFDPSEAGNLS